MDSEQRDGEPVRGNEDVVLEANVEGRLDAEEEYCEHSRNSWKRERTDDGCDEAT